MPLPSPSPSSLRLARPLLSSLVMSALVCASARGATPPFAEEPSPEEESDRSLLPPLLPLEFEADEQEGRFDIETFTLRGNAWVRSKDEEIRAQEITGNLSTTEITATGCVIATAEGQKLEGERARGNLRNRTLSLDGNVRLDTFLEVPNREEGPRALPISVRAQHIDYDFLLRTGSLNDLQMTTMGLQFRGQSGIVLPTGRMSLVRAEFSACPLDELGEGERYGYSLRARTVDVKPEGEAMAHRVSVHIGGTRVAQVSRLRIRGNEGGGATAEVPLPRIGRSSLAGYFLSWGFQPTVLPGVVADTRFDLASKAGIRAFSTIRASGGGPNPYLRVHVKEEAEGREPRRVLVNRLPEVGFMLDNESRSRWTRWVRGEASFGYIEQRGPRRRATRAQLYLMAQPIPIREWGRWRLNARPGLRLAAYGTGDSYRDLSAEVAVTRRWDARRNVRAGFARHFIGGRTPFTFDEALIPTELFSTVNWSFGPWGVGASIRYDAGRGELFDAKFGIGHVIRCIEPRIVYSHRLRQVRLEVNLVGLTNLSDLPPAESAPGRIRLREGNRATKPDSHDHHDHSAAVPPPLTRKVGR